VGPIKEKGRVCAQHVQKKLVAWGKGGGDLPRGAGIVRGSRSTNHASYFPKERNFALVFAGKVAREGKGQ